MSRINGMRRLFLILALAVASSLSGQLRRGVAPSPPPQRVILPFGYGLHSVTTGVPNEVWFSIATIRNRGTGPLSFSSYAGCSFDPCTPQIVRQDVPAGKSQLLTAALIYVNQGDATFSVRVDDVTSRPGNEETYSPSGIEIPPVRTGDFHPRSSRRKGPPTSSTTSRSSARGTAAMTWHSASSRRRPSTRSSCSTTPSLISSGSCRRHARRVSCCVR